MFFARELFSGFAITDGPMVDDRLEPTSCRWQRARNGCNHGAWIPINLFPLAPVTCVFRGTVDDESRRPCCHMLEADHRH